MAVNNKPLDDLQAEVAETVTIQESAIKLIRGLSQAIKDAGTDPAKLNAITAQLDSKNAELAAAIAENTPDEGGGEPTPA